MSYSALITRKQLMSKSRFDPRNHTGIGGMVGCPVEYIVEDDARYLEPADGIADIACDGGDSEDVCKRCWETPLKRSRLYDLDKKEFLFADTVLSHDTDSI